MQTIETERFILRPFKEEDAAGLFELDSDPEVHRYLGNQPITTLQQAQDVISFIRQQYKDNGIGRWAVINKATGEFTGWSGLKWNTAPCNGYDTFYDVGYRLIRRFWGQGIATETGKAALHYAFTRLKADAVYARAHVNNLASNAVLKKLGLRFVNELVEDELPINWYELHASIWKPA